VSHLVVKPFDIARNFPGTIQELSRNEQRSKDLKIHCSCIAVALQLHCSYIQVQVAVNLYHFCPTSRTEPKMETLDSRLAMSHFLPTSSKMPLCHIVVIY